MNPEHSHQETETASSLPNYIGMYAIPGYEAISPKGYYRYIRNEDQLPLIVAQAEENQAKKDKSFAWWENQIEQTPDNKRAGLIRQGLNNPDPAVQLACADMINRAPDNERAGLIRQGLDNHNPAVQRACARMVWQSPDNEQAGLRTKVLEIIRQGLNNPDPAVLRVCADMIKQAPDNEQAGLIRQGLNNPNPAVQRACAIMIEWAPKYEQAGLRTKVLEIIRQGLDNPDPAVQRAWVDMIKQAPSNERAGLIRQGLDNHEPAVQRACANMIEWAPVNERAGLRTKVLETIQRGLDNPDPAVQRACADMIKWAPDNEKAGLIRQGLDNSDPAVLRACVDMIWRTPNNEQAELVKVLKEKGLTSLVIEPPLYKGSNMTPGRFQRAKFTKTGSETTLLGGELEGKAIVRQLTLEAFLTWKKLYDDHQLWHNNGFDYVPIEPIFSFRLNRRTGLVDVYTGVLDLNLADWKKISHEIITDENIPDNFISELEQDRDRILKVLDEMHIIHGHAHDANFCLRFERKRGNPVFSKKPRIYLIDFDQAISP